MGHSFFIYNLHIMSKIASLSSIMQASVCSNNELDDSNVDLRSTKMDLGTYLPALIISKNLLVQYGYVIELQLSTEISFSR